MRLTRVGAVVSVLLAGAVALPASASEGLPPALAGTTTVVTDHSATMLVTLYDDATLSFKSTANPDTRIHGRGRFVGLWLYRPDNGGLIGQDYLGLYRLPSFAHRPTTTFGSRYPAQQCKQTATSPVLGPNCSYPSPARGILLHQGVYRMTVVADGAPVRFTLHLHGAQGATTLRPSTVVRSAEETLPRREAVSDNMVSFGAAASKFDDNTTLLELASVTIPPDASAWGDSSCIRHDDGSSEPMAYGPLCPNGADTGGEWHVQAGPAQEGGVWVSGTNAQSSTGVLGLGGSFWSEKGVQFHHALGVWLDDSCDCWTF